MVTLYDGLTLKDSDILYLFVGQSTERTMQCMYQISENNDSSNDRYWTTGPPEQWMKGGIDFIKYRKNMAEFYSRYIEVII